MPTIILFLVYCLLTTPCFAFTGKVVNVADGDTVTVLAKGNQQTRIRLYGIDAPEKRQAFGQKSKDALARILAGKTVDVQVLDVDRYGRSVGVITTDGINANREMINNGLAWVYTRYCTKKFCREWETLEQSARRAKRGLWLDADPMPPWEWRKNNRRKK